MPGSRKTTNPLRLEPLVVERVIGKVRRGQQPPQHPRMLASGERLTNSEPPFSRINDRTSGAARTFMLFPIDRRFVPLNPGFPDNLR